MLTAEEAHGLLNSIGAPTDELTVGDNLTIVQKLRDRALNGVMVYQRAAERSCSVCLCVPGDQFVTSGRHGAGNRPPRTDVVQSLRCGLLLAKEQHARIILGR